MKVLINILCIVFSITSFAQNPVSLKYTTKKVADKIFEIHIIATIDKGWHLYSQIQPEEAIAVPTTIKFAKHPLVKISGKIKEIGKLEKDKDPELGIEQWQYSEKVDFVQTVILKGNVKTSVNGSIEYQVCTEGRCLPPKMIEFSVKLE